MSTSYAPSWDSTAGVAAAPGRLEVVRQFLNTVNVLYETDVFETTQSARRWLREAGLLRANAQMSELDCAKLIDLREALRALAAAHAGHPLSRTALTRLNRLASGASIRPVFDGEGGVRLTGAKGDVDDAITALLAIVCDSIRDGSWFRLKVCHDETCCWAFYDSSRNRVGTWCSMAFCGNRAKTRAYRQRQRAVS